MIADHIAQLDGENRETVFELIACDPNAGHLVREYLDVFQLHHDPLKVGVLELIAWLILAREACGIEGVGHA